MQTTPAAFVGGSRSSGGGVGEGGTATAVACAPGIGAGPGSVIYMPVISTGSHELYHHRQSIGLGIIQVLIGIVGIVFNSVGLGFSKDMRWSGMLFIGYGIWSGIMFIIAGSLGISAGQTKVRCKIVSFMVTCILSACFTAPLLALAVLGTLLSRPPNYSCSENLYYNPYSSCNNVESYQVVLAMQAMLAILAVIEAVIATWGAAICCQAVCCCAQPSSERVMVPANYFSDNGHMLYGSQMSGAAYMYNPTPTYPGVQGQIAPPAYQASILQPSWSQGQGYHPSALCPSAPDLEGPNNHPPPYPLNPPSYPSNLPARQPAEPPKY